MRELQLRAMQAADLAEVAVLEQMLHSHPWSVAQVETLALGEQFCGFVACSDGRIVAYVLLQILAGELEVLTLGVSANQQNRGVASVLLEYVWGETQAVACFLEVRLSNVAALALYRKLGFVQVGVRKNYYVSGAGREDGLILRLDLNNESDGGHD
jgi:ribosomal-protein-alanine N-acetyltransferase